MEVPVTKIQLHDQKVSRTLPKMIQSKPVIFKRKKKCAPYPAKSKSTSDELDALPLSITQYQL